PLPCLLPLILLLFFFTAPAPPETYPLSLHDALPIFGSSHIVVKSGQRFRASLIAGTMQLESADDSEGPGPLSQAATGAGDQRSRSEEHTSELQSLTNLVCRLLLEKKKKKCDTT